MVILRAGIGGDLRPAPVGIALAEPVFVAYGADHGRLGSFDQTARIEPLVEVAFEVAQRRLIAACEPVAEAGFAVGEVAAGGHAAEVEARFRGEFFDSFGSDHDNNLVQR